MHQHVTSHILQNLETSLPDEVLWPEEFSKYVEFHQERLPEGHLPSSAPQAELEPSR